MPFGLRNAPAAFQWLMQQVTSGLNPDEGPGFVSVYIDDILVYSKSLPEHIQHLEHVFARLQQYGLKLKRSKCRLLRQEVQYLGHVLTPDGLKTSKDHVQSVKDFPTPMSVSEVRKFLGLA